MDQVTKQLFNAPLKSLGRGRAGPLYPYAKHDLATRDPLQKGSSLWSPPTGTVALTRVETSCDIQVSQDRTLLAQSLVQFLPEIRHRP